MDTRPTHDDYRRLATMPPVRREPTREQDRTAEMISEMRGGWAEVSPPTSTLGGVVVTVGGGDRYWINPDGSYLDPDNRLHEPEEE